MVTRLYHGHLRRQHVDTCFDRWDPDGSGALSLKELAAALSAPPGADTAAARPTTAPPPRMPAIHRPNPFPARYFSHLCSRQHAPPFPGPAGYRPGQLDTFPDLGSSAPTASSFGGDPGAAPRPSDTPRPPATPRLARPAAHADRRAHRARRAHRLRCCRAGLGGARVSRRGARRRGDRRWRGGKQRGKRRGATRAAAGGGGGCGGDGGGGVCGGPGGEQLQSRAGELHLSRRPGHGLRTPPAAAPDGCRRSPPPQGGRPPRRGAPLVGAPLVGGPLPAAEPA